MRSRLMNKRNKKLKVAIRELNTDVAISLGDEPISDAQVLEVFNRIKNNPDAVNRTLKDYQKYILGGRK
ncbi:hypothetical protein [Bacillus mycoides]|uniref:hypothetical protein n=1 Tax=Bacillus mycoides TaxID=1405 RepID=UPI003A811546